MADAVRPTLGPLPRNVAIDRIVKSESQSIAELLDNGGLIARRILQVPDADADMGLMFMRQLLPVRSGFCSEPESANSFLMMLWVRMNQE